MLFNLTYKAFEFNADYQYLGYQENIDAAFVSTAFTSLSPAFAGLKNYRDAYEAAGSKGYNILNIGFAYKATSKFKIGVIIKNITNQEWMTRPGQFQAPRNFTLQLAYQI